MSTVHANSTVHVEDNILQMVVSIVLQSLHVALMAVVAVMRSVAIVKMGVTIVAQDIVSTKDQQLDTKQLVKK